MSDPRAIQAGAPPAIGSGGRPRSRRRRPVVPLLVLLALMGGLVALVVARSSPEQQVRRLMDRQLKLAIAQRWGQLHATLTAKAKQACPRVEFLSEVQRLSGTDPNFWHVIDFRDINIQVRGDVAAVTYVITYNGRVVERATPQAPDLYARATRTVVGPKPNLQTALANLARAASPGPNQAITQKEYEAQKARLLKFGAKPPVIYKKGQWYDDLDSHIHCGP
ncbi:MAG: hypothetical protein E6G44_08920 [Actinobacteria bacterium]|nr:MAG: hypothetical protein E6G44_08920 [Actinomycetota bacterium]